MDSKTKMERSRERFVKINSIWNKKELSALAADYIDEFAQMAKRRLDELDSSYFELTNLEKKNEKAAS